MIIVDGVSLDWDGRPMTIYQFLSQKGIIVPCFCYHEKLNIAGNCRMCLVEANGAMVVSCAMPLLPQMQLVTQSERLSHSRENVLEFLLANHPLDCPICDQGGECDLQDISKTFGLDRGRFYETKRSVDNLNCFGSMVKTLMTRCIHCTRCVRFLSEYCDESFFGVIGRGSSMEIGSFVSSAFIDHPLAANVIDLCPVGALTSMPYAFTARPWECKSIESIDIMDSLAGGLRFDVAHNKVVRCLPLITESLNEDWMSNKARFVYYSLQRQFFDKPQLKVSGEWRAISWRNAAIVFLESLILKKRELLVRGGNFVDLETAALLKFFCQDFRAAAPFNESIGQASTLFPELFLFNSSLEQFEDTSLVLLIGCNLRKENPLVFSRLRRNYLRRKSTDRPLKVFSIGAACDYDGVPSIQLGSSVETIDLLLKGRLNGTKDFFFSGFQNVHLLNLNIVTSLHPYPKMIVGPSIFKLPKAGELQHRLWNFSILWQNLLGPVVDPQPIYNACLDYLGKLSFLALGCSAGQLISDEAKSKSSAVIWNFSTATTGRRTASDLIIYQGYHLPSAISGDVDLFLPTASPLETESFFLNVLGYVRASKLVLCPLKTTYSDPQIIRFFHRFAHRFLSYKKENDHLAERLGLSHQSFPWSKDFGSGFQNHFGFPLEHNWHFGSHRGYPGLAKIKAPISEEVLEHSLLGDGGGSNYYSSDIFCELSPVLVSCALRCLSSNFVLRVHQDFQSE